MEHNDSEAKLYKLVWVMYHPQAGESTREIENGIKEFLSGIGNIFSKLVGLL